MKQGLYQLDFQLPNTFLLPYWIKQLHFVALQQEGFSFPKWLPCTLALTCGISVISVDT